MRGIIAILLCAMLVTPAFAATYQLSAEPLANQDVKILTGITKYTLDTSPNRAIQRITLDMPSDCTVDFTLTYGSENTVMGFGKYLHTGQSCNNITGNAFCNYNELSIGGSTKGYNFIGLSQMNHMNIIGYARRTDDNKTGIIVYDDVLGLNNPSSPTVFYDTGVSSNIIYKVQITADKPIGLTIYTADKATLQSTVSLSPSEQFDRWVRMAEGLSSMVLGLVTGLIFWISFFFVGENLLLIVTLYISGSMAITAYRVKGNPVAFLPRFFKDQKAFFEFMLSVWNMLVSTVGTVIGWFRLI